MSRQTLISIGILLLVFGLGIGAGLYLGGGTSTASASDKGTNKSFSGFSSPEVQERVEQNTILSHRILDLEKELAQRKADDGAKARFDFFKQHHSQIQMAAFDGNLKVTPEMTLILGLSGAEQSAVSAHLAQSRNEMNQLIEADKTPVKQNGDSLSYEISADPHGKDLKDKLLNKLTADIGADRAEVLMDYGDFSSYSAFNDFDQSKKDVGLTWDQNNGHTQYKETTTFYGPDGAQRGSMSSTSPDSVPPDFQKYLPSGTPAAMPPAVTR